MPLGDAAPGHAAPIEALARRFEYGDVIDAWRDELNLVRRPLAWDRALEVVWWRGFREGRQRMEIEL